MFWQEDDTDKALQVPDDIVDVLFSVDCKHLPVDHAYALSAALQRAAPWIAAENSGVAVHTVHVAGSQNGWERPEQGTDQHLILSKRTKLVLRVPKTRMDRLMLDLKGKALDVSGCILTIGSGKVRPLSRGSTLFSRYLVGPVETAAGPLSANEQGFGNATATPVAAPRSELPSHDSEEGFLDWVAQQLRDMDIRVRKALCGKSTTLSTPDGMLPTRSLMLADLSPEESVRLQQRGLGPHRAMGCGIFIPHKGIDAVAKPT